MAPDRNILKDLVTHFKFDMLIWRRPEYWNSTAIFRVLLCAHFILHWEIGQRFPVLAIIAGGKSREMIPL